MISGGFLVVGFVLLVWAIVAMLRRPAAFIYSDSPSAKRARFYLPGRKWLSREPPDFWSLLAWGIGLAVVVMVVGLSGGGLPGIGGGGAPPASPSTSTTGAPQAQDSPPPEAVVHEGTPYFRSYANWYSEAGDSCAGDGCLAGAYLAAQRRLTQ